MNAIFAFVYIYMIILISIMPGIVWPYTIGLIGSGIFLAQCYWDDEELMSAKIFVPMAYVFFIFGDAFMDQFGVDHLFQSVMTAAAVYINQTILAIYLGLTLGSWMFPVRRSIGNAPSDFTLKPNSQIILVLVGLILLPWILATVYIGAFSGRHAVAALPIPSFMRAILNSAVISYAMFCTLFIVYCRYASAAVYFFGGMIVLIAVAAFISGTRTNLLYTATMVSFAAFASFRTLRLSQVTLRQALPAAALLIGVILLSQLMVDFRNSFYPSDTAFVSDAVDVYIEEDPVAATLRESFRTEGILYYNSVLQSYFIFRDHLYGTEHLVTLSIFVPRALWPDKGELMGAWLVRAADTRTYGDGHSGAFGVGGAAFADFGATGGVIMCAIYGVLIAAVNALFLNSVYRGSRLAVCLAFLPASVFFFIRSPSTAYVLSVGYIVIGLVLCLLVLRSNRDRLAIRPSEAPPVPQPVREQGAVHS